LKNLFKISFRISPFQEFLTGSLVTYRDENFLGYIKETLYSRSNFFYIKSIDWEVYECEISNGIDSVKTTPDQLVEVVAYVEKKVGDEVIENTIQNIINNNVINIESYILYDQSMAIYLEESIFSRDYFSLVNVTSRVNLALKTYKTAKFMESKLHEIL
jgi:hypothetical protein